MGKIPEYIHIFYPCSIVIKNTCLSQIPVSLASFCYMLLAEMQAIGSELSMTPNIKDEDGK
jgi:hypothetical protein